MKETNYIKEKGWKRLYKEDMLMKKINNVVEMLHQVVEKYPDKDALLWKEEGSYVNMTYREFWERIKQFAHGLLTIGVKKGDKVAIIANSGVQWAISDFAIASIGAVSVPVYPTLPTERVDYILNKTESTVAIVEDQEQFTKVINAKTPIKHLVVMSLASDVTLGQNEYSFDQLTELGAENLVDTWEETWTTFTRDRLLTIISTSGTTGNPKGAIISHGNILSNIEGVSYYIQVRPDDVTLSYLPVSHVLERTAGHYLPLSVGMTIAYAESIDTIPDNLKEIRPTIFTSVPRLFEKIYTTIQEQINNSSPLKQRIFNWALSVGKERYDYYLNARVDEFVTQTYMPKSLQRRWKMANRLVFQKIKDQLGGRARVTVSGGGTLNKDIARFFWALDIPIYEGYGLTETSPIVTANPMTKGKAGTVGKVLPNIDVKIASDGEILVKGPSITEGYYNDPEETAESFDGDWFKTGDVGEFDEEGYLKILDRKKRILVLSTGMNVAPQPIENAMNESSYIAQSLVIGEDRNYILAIINPEFESLFEWAKRKGIKESDPKKLCHNPQVKEMLEREVYRLTERFTNYSQPKKVIIASDEWTIEGGELTPKLSLRANVVEDRYEELIENAYSEEVQEVS